MSAGLKFDSTCQTAIARAKNSLAEGAPLGIEQLLAALYYAGDLRTRFPEIAAAVPEPVAVRTVEGTVPLSETLKPIMNQLSLSSETVTADRLFAALFESEAGHKWLNERGVTESQWQAVRWALHPASGQAAAPRGPWRSSAARNDALVKLKPLGRVLTETEIAGRGTTGIDANIRKLVRILSKMRRRSAMIVGPPGTGKSALVYTLAQRIVQQHESIPPALRDVDIFELSPAFLRSGTMYSGQYEEKVTTLLSILQANPKIFLFVDEVHSLFQSGIHSRSMYSDTNESFKGAVGRGDITLIGCTTLAEYRALIAPDAALERRFSILKLEAASRDATLDILRERRPKIEEYFKPLTISDKVLERVVDLSDEYLPSRFQPDKALQLLDESCACAATDDPPAPALTEGHVVQALEDMVGQSLASVKTLSVDQVLKELKDRIIGQDEAIQKIATSFVAGMANVARPQKARHVFFFGGPTGVGKTEVARLLSQILGGGIGRKRENMIRVDCNNLGGSNAAWEIGWKLFGVQAGYVGFVRGEGGVLSRIRDKPESIVLFDEVEKADPSLSRHLLRVLEEGQAEDSDGNLLDFRRAYIIFTSNAGITYRDTSRGSLGFVNTQNPEEDPDSETPTADVPSIQEALRRLGYGEEFFGRIDSWVVFRGLTADSVQQIVENQLSGLKDKIKDRGLDLAWDPELIAHLSSGWQPRFGVRHLTTILANRLVEQLGIADAQGELVGVKRVHLKRHSSAAQSAESAASPIAVHRKDGQTLVIELA